jgi:hypothetical protein
MLARLTPTRSLCAPSLSPYKAAAWRSRCASHAPTPSKARRVNTLLHTLVGLNTQYRCQAGCREKESQPPITLSVSHHLLSCHSHHPHIARPLRTQALWLAWVAQSIDYVPETMSTIVPLQYDINNVVPKYLVKVYDSESDAGHVQPVRSRPRHSFPLFHAWVQH